MDDQERLCRSDHSQEQSRELIPISTNKQELREGFSFTQFFYCHHPILCYNTIMNTHMIYEGDFAGHTVTFRFLHEDTPRYFRGRLRPSASLTADAAVTPEQIERTRYMDPPGALDAYTEYRCLIGETARVLLSHDCCIFHAVCFVYQGYAWLLTAPSGTGKTTQFRNWISTHPGEIIMISGDMPVLERRDDGSVWAHPSAWNGKENIGYPVVAPVAGVVLLEQGGENRLAPLSVREGLKPVFDQFLVRPETEEQILALGRLADQMFRTIPFWKLVNLGDPASTELLREAFTKRLKELPRSILVPVDQAGSKSPKGDAT